MIYTNCAACGAESTVFNPVEQASVTQGPGHRALWTALLCQRCTIGMLDRATDKAPASNPAPECEQATGDGTGAATALRDIAAAALNALPDIDPHDDDAALVDVVLRDPRFEREVRRVAPKFVRVRLPRLRGIGEPYALTWNNAIDDCRDALRAQGVELEP